MTLSSTSTLSFIALPVSMRPAVLDAVTRAWRRGVSKTGQVEYAPELMKKHKEKGCDGGVWEVTLKGDCWVPGSADKVSYVYPRRLSRCKRWTRKLTLGRSGSWCIS
jgi:hypothetical protein